MLDPAILLPALPDAVRKLDPRHMIKNPVMFVVEVVTVLTTVLLVRDLRHRRGRPGFSSQIVLWLWFTLLFANLAEAVAEGRGKAQAGLAAPHPDRGQGQARASADRPQLARGLGARPSSPATSSWSRPAT